MPSVFSVPSVFLERARVPSSVPSSVLSVPSVLLERPRVPSVLSSVPSVSSHVINPLRTSAPRGHTRTRQCPCVCVCLVRGYFYYIQTILFTYNYWGRGLAVWPLERGPRTVPVNIVRFQL